MGKLQELEGGYVKFIYQIGEMKFEKLFKVIDAKEEMKNFSNKPVENGFYCYLRDCVGITKEDAEKNSEIKNY